MKKNSLMDSLNKAAGKTSDIIEKKLEVREKKESNNSYVPHSRVGKKAITGFFEPEVNKELKMLGLEQDASNQDLVKEALNDLFIKYGKKPIA
jgi:hypothetical protein